ncbi:MAG: hypothetical protein IPN92_08300 [Chromatiaceae bacterium]|nr:hypothetical protein [Chromatiaceae bacterium]
MNPAPDQTVTLCCLGDDPSTPPAGPFFFVDGDVLSDGLDRCLGIVLPRAGEARARELLVAGAPRVLMGEAALRDPTLVQTLAQQFGPDRVGVYVPAARQRVSWSLDSVCNADFKVMAPTQCEPAWEVLLADDTPSGTHVAWWVREMFKRGAALALVRADMVDDADLNICAGLAEECGDRLWFGPRHQAPDALGDWIAYGHARQLVFTQAIYEGHEAVLAFVARPEHPVPRREIAA